MLAGNLAGILGLVSTCLNLVKKYAEKCGTELEVPSMSVKCCQFVLAQIGNKMVSDGNRRTSDYCVCTCGYMYVLISSQAWLFL